MGSMTSIPSHIFKCRKESRRKLIESLDEFYKDMNRIVEQHTAMDNITEGIENIMSYTAEGSIFIFILNCDSEYNAYINLYVYDGNKPATLVSTIKDYLYDEYHMEELFNYIDIKCTARSLDEILNEHIDNMWQYCIIEVKKNSALYKWYTPNNNMFLKVTVLSNGDKIYHD